MTLKKTIQKQIKKEIQAIERYELKHRSFIERASAMILILFTLFSVTGLGHDDERRTKVNREVIAQVIPVFNAPDKSAEKNETVRMPIKFDDGLRAVANSGV